MFPKVALIGRPNVGKSTLFNRLIGRKSAIVYNQPGVTRDRRQHDGDLFGQTYTFIDTPGLFDPGSTDVHPTIQEGMKVQALKALTEADVICFIIDGQAGCAPHDYQLAEMLRRLSKPILLLVNKSEGKKGIQGLSDAMSLGLSAEIFPISAEHGEGLYDFATALYDLTHSAQEEDVEDSSPEEEVPSDEKPERAITLTILGRPNVGKSTLFNALVGEERQLTGAISELTRDSVRYPFQYDDQSYILIDTAGIRKRSQVTQDVEKLSVLDATKSYNMSDVVLLVLDGSLPLEDHFEKQDLILAQTVLKEGRGLVLVVNKWDQVKSPKAYLEHLNQQISIKLAQAKGVQIVPVSAYTPHTCFKIFDAVRVCYQEWNKRISTAILNRWFDEVTERHAPPIVNGQRIKLKYITQIKSRPPTFVIFGTKCDDVPESYKRYLIQSMKEVSGCNILLFAYRLEVLRIHMISDNKIY